MSFSWSMHGGRKEHDGTITFSFQILDVKFPNHYTGLYTPYTNLTNLVLMHRLFIFVQITFISKLVCNFCLYPEISHIL